MNKTIRKVFNVITWVLICIVLVLALMLAGLRIFGFRMYTVVSSSMEPEIKTGSIVYVKNVKPGELDVGDTITYALDNKGNTDTHKLGLIQNTMQGTRYYTYGINNDNYQYDEDGKIKTDKYGNKLHVFDPATSYDNIQGKVVFYIPYFGYVAAFISNPPGLYIAIAFAALLLLLVFLPDLIFPKEKEAANAAAVTNADVPLPETENKED